MAEKKSRKKKKDEFVEVCVLLEELQITHHDIHENIKYLIRMAGDKDYSTKDTKNGLKVIQKQIKENESRVKQLFNTIDHFENELNLLTLTHLC
jgi:hypothetical protein